MKGMRGGWGLDSLIRVARVSVALASNEAGEFFADVAIAGGRKWRRF